MRHGTRQLSGERACHGAWRPATGLVLRRHVAGFYSAVDSAFVEGGIEAQTRQVPGERQGGAERGGSGPVPSGEGGKFRSIATED